MATHTFRCETCNYSQETTDTKTPHFCPKCKKRLYWDFSNSNIGREGDFKKFYSYDLGAQINSSSDLKKELKKRGMVCLTESKEVRDYNTEMLDRARAGEFDHEKN